jgi:hypothetical protein
MGRFLAGVASALLLAGAGIFVWTSMAEQPGPIPAAPAGAGATGPVALAPLGDPPRATDKTREERRFSRYDKDRNGGVAREEYLATRRKAFAKLDSNGDGQLGFDEWAVRTSGKFAAADRDRSGVLTPAEFATTRVVRKPSLRSDCPPVRQNDDE